MSDFQTDYLIVGAGAVGLAFADTLLDEDPSCHITIVDKHAKPGGHWNDAYGFVALHQPSATYGVNSLTFPSEQIDTQGPNQGLHALASGTEVLAYFEKVMNMKLLPSGRVAYYPLSEFAGRGDSGTASIRSILSGEETHVSIRRKVVDATFYQTSVPSTHRRSFTEEDVEVVPPGDLPRLWQRNTRPAHYVILGAGKTAMDAVIWLIQNGVDPDLIAWVRPRESWLWNREYVQPGEDFFEAVMELQTAILTTAEEAEDSADLMRRMGDNGYYLRIDPDVEPTMFHYAIISHGEIDLLRRVRRVIRNGHVTAITPGRLHFGDSVVEVPPESLFVDCTASAVPFTVRGDAQGPIFRGDTIVLQPLQVPLVVLSAAIAAYLEANLGDDEARNALATPGPLTDSPATFAYAQMINFMNRGAWRQNPKIMEFLARSRLDLTTGTIFRLVEQGSPKLAALQAFGDAADRCMPALVQLGTRAKALHENAEAYR